jgi:ArsR family transcriptional regulator
MVVDTSIIVDTSTSVNGNSEIEMELENREMVNRLPVIDVVEAEECCPSVLAAPLGEPQATVLAKGFAALGDPARLRVLSMLAAAPEGEVCVCEFVGPLGKSQPTVSHHLKVLADAGLITGDRRGKWVWYSLVPERLAALRSALQR